MAGAITDLSDLLALDADEQAAVGFYCGGQMASLNHAITHCTSSELRGDAAGDSGARHLQSGSQSARESRRETCSISAPAPIILYVRERFKVKLQFTVTNLTNNEALYNFLSTFSGTHFVTPRTYEAELGFIF